MKADGWGNDDLLPEIKVNTDAMARTFELVRQGHHNKARELQAILMRASKLIVSELGIAGIKFAMDQRGYRGGIPRLPLLPLHHEQTKHLSEFMAALEPAVLRA